MLDKLELKFCYVSHLPENEAERGRIEKICTGLEDMFFSIVFESIGERPIEIDPTGADTFGLLNFAKKYLQTPQPIVSILSDPKRSLLETAIFRLNRLRSTVDFYEAAFRSKPEHYSNMEKEMFNQRFRYMREQFQNWAECINAGRVDIFEIRPTLLFEAKFPTTYTKYPWQPEAEKVKREPEEFRQIWLNPEEDIPFVLEALKRLDFIDENEVWRWNTKEYNPRGVVEAIQLNTNRFSNFSGEHRARVFAKRFKFPNPEKRFEKKGENYNRAMAKMANYLKNNK